MVQVVDTIYHGQIAVILKFILLIQHITHQLSPELYGQYNFVRFAENYGTFEYVYKNSNGYIILIETYSSENLPNGHDFRNKSNSYETYITIYESESHKTDYSSYEYQPASYSGYSIRDGVTMSQEKTVNTKIWYV